MTGRATIHDVARLAGVSLTTVSNVLNGTKTARIAETTRSKVEQAAAELRYTPSRVARGLRLQRTQILGMVSDYLATIPHASEMLLGAQEAALKRGYHILLLNTGGQREAEQAAITTLDQLQVDGIIYAAMYHRIVDPPSSLSPDRAVLLDAWAPGGRLRAVVPDEVGGAHTATEELIRLGHRRIGFLTSVDDIPATHGRLAGYRQALRAADIRFNHALVLAQDSVGTDGGHQGAMTLLTRRDRPTALFCFNDRMAMGAYRAIAELNLRIPDDVSVIGFDNQELIATGLSPALTTVALPHYAMGVWAVTTLLDRLHTEHPPAPPTKPVKLTCLLVQRQSTGSPPPVDTDTHQEA